MASLAINLAETGGSFVMGLLAAHDKRVAAAKSENAAVSAALAALIHDFQVIVSSYNSGEMTLQSAIASCLNIDAWYWQYIAPLSQYKDANQASCNPNQLGVSAKLSKGGSRCWQSSTSGEHFTAADYMGCNIVDAALGTLIAALQSLEGRPTGTSTKVSICSWPTNKYGLQPYSGSDYVLTVPKAISQEQVSLSQSGILSVGSPNQGSSSAGFSFSSISGSSSTLLIVGGVLFFLLLLIFGSRQ